MVIVEMKEQNTRKEEEEEEEEEKEEEEEEEARRCLKSRYHSTHANTHQTTQNA